MVHHIPSLVQLPSSDSPRTRCRIATRRLPTPAHWRLSLALLGVQQRSLDACGTARETDLGTMPSAERCAVEAARVETADAKWTARRMGTVVAVCVGGGVGVVFFISWLVNQ